jgi:hypothetical protein
MTVYCKNKRCRHCYTDSEENDVLVCFTTPSFISIPSARVFVLKCNTYLKREPGDRLRAICPVGPDGLFPGQLKAPIDDPTPAPVETVEECDT